MSSILNIFVFIYVVLAQVFNIYKLEIYWLKIYKNYQAMLCMSERNGIKFI